MKEDAQIQVLKVITGKILGLLAEEHNIPLDKIHERLTSAFENQLDDKQYAAEMVECLDAIFVIAKAEADASGR